MKYTKVAALIGLAALVAIVGSACFGGGSSSEAVNSTPTLPRSTSAEPLKPKPVVLAVYANTAGLFENYNAILDITVSNEGADGMVLVVGSINQGSVNIKEDLPVYLASGATQTVKMVFPLKWRGGEWTPSVLAEIP